MTALADPHAAPATPPAKEARTVTLSVPDMRCAGCIRGVEGALAALPGVAAARVNLTDKQVRVTGTLPPERLVAALAEAGHTAAEMDDAALAPAAKDAEGRALLLRIGVAGFAMMNVMTLSVAVWSGAGDATRDLFHWISAAIALPAAIYAARPFFASALAALKAGRLNMDVPISLAILLALGISVAETVQSGHTTFFDAALSLTLFLLIGRYLDHRTRRAARSAAAALTALEVPRATKLVSGTPVQVPTADLAVGDLVRVAAGGRIPVDGVVAEGSADLDRSMLTGESLPVAVRTGGRVAAGETVVDAPLTVRATAVGADTSLRRMAEAVAVAEGARNRHVALADRAAALYAPLVHGVALAGFLGWWLIGGDAYKALLVACALLIITCPCALGLAVPAVSVSSTGRLFRRGLLLKSGTALERLAEVDSILLDKTGTLTTGLLRLPDLDDEAASVALALARSSDHPVARSVAGALEGHAPAALTDIRETQGDGVEASWNGAPVRLGRGPSGTELGLPGRDPVPLAIEETLRPGARALVAEAQRAGLPVRLLSGDRPAQVARVAEELGITDWQGGMSPEEKAQAIRDWAADGRKALMVGDGLNDAHALSLAHVSIAPATALDAARAAADGVLLGGDLSVIPGALRTARIARNRMLQNFGLAAGYNAVSVPVALAGLASPLLAALAMSTSSILVVLNAVRPELGRAGIGNRETRA
jgi:Cu2+-exporting ATPase